MTAARKRAGAPAKASASTRQGERRPAKAARSAGGGARSAKASASAEAREITRVQTGVRMERRIVKVLKALAEYHDLSLGDLLEGVVLHAFEGRCAFGADSLERIARLREVYELDLVAADSHRLREPEPA